MKQSKSAKTISRTLLPPRIIPRFSMGSVETRGPDSVLVHKHEMLEQLFIGLNNTQCKVTCDNNNVIMNEYDIIHIPLGSLHGVEVADGFLLHYIWMDYFLVNSDYSWIDKNHKENK